MAGKLTDFFSKPCQSGLNLIGLKTVFVAPKKTPRILQGVVLPKIGVRMGNCVLNLGRPLVVLLSCKSI
jgi:hypothetical protein